MAASRALLCLIALWGAVAACGRGGVRDVTRDLEGLPALDPECPPDAPTVGYAEGLAISRTWSAVSRDLSVADPVHVQVPDGVGSLLVTLDGGLASTAFAAAWLDGRVLLDAAGAAPFGSPLRGEGADTFGLDAFGWYREPWFAANGLTMTLQLPMSEDTMPWSGCLALRPAAAGDAVAGDEVVVHVLAAPDDVAPKALDLNLVVVDGAGISDRDLERATARMFEVYAGATSAPSAGEITLWTVDSVDAYLPVGGRGLAELRSVELPGADPRALSLFFIADFTGDGGVLGIAAGIPGPQGIPGTAGSGVVMSVEAHLDANGDLDIATLGETMAHEAGHQLGLFHTTEASGDSFDLFTDTPECDAESFDGNGDDEVDAEECGSADGANFMFWTAGDVRQDRISTEQGRLLSRSVVARPAGLRIGGVAGGAR